jgi:hypothetical protein
MVHCTRICRYTFHDGRGKLQELRTSEGVFPIGVNDVGNHLVEGHLPVNCALLHSIANRRLVVYLRFGTALASCSLVCLRTRRGGRESSFFGASLSVDTTSDDLAVRVLRNPVAGGSCSSVALGSRRRSANAVWTDAECRSDRGQRWSDASCWNAFYTSSREPDVAGCDAENAAVLSSRPRVAGTV